MLSSDRLGRLSPEQRASLHRRLLLAGEEAHQKDGVRSIPPLTPAGVTEPVPASHAQERMWFLSRFDPGGWLHNLLYVQQADNERTPPAVRS